MYPTKNKGGYIFMKKKLDKAIDELVLTRIQDAELSEKIPQELQKAYNAVDKSIEALCLSLNDEQRKLYNNLDNALSQQSGEEKNYLFRRGISDGIRIGFKLMGGKHNEE
jgi:uncharacterized membrane-anchored protein YhcB (DUF1043 family)